jgi:hypothetical protein
MSQGLCSIMAQNESARLVVWIFLMVACARGENHGGHLMSQPVTLEFLEWFAAAW